MLVSVFLVTAQKIADILWKIGYALSDARSWAGFLSLINL
jgi:hypothetical protein